MIGRWLPVLLLTSTSLAMAQDTGLNAAVSAVPATSQTPASAAAAHLERPGETIVPDAKCAPES
jgi:hypothetical protein